MQNKKYKYAFQSLKKAFTTQFILLHFNLDWKIVIEINVSDYFLGGILSQYDNNRILYLIFYFSEKLWSNKYN